MAENNTVDWQSIDPRQIDNPHSRARIAKKFGQVVNPIPAQIRDSDELQKFFVNFDGILVPYAGDEHHTSQSLLYFLMDLLENSPTQGAVIESMKHFCFGGKVDIVRRLDPVFNLGNEEEDGGQPLELTLKREFYQFLKDHIVYVNNAGQEISIKEFVCNNFHDWKGSGNAYIELVFVETNGLKKIFVHSHNPTHNLRLYTEKGEINYMAISPVWSNRYLMKHKPVILPLFPYMVDQADGVQRTLIQEMNGNNRWYGRPDSISSLLYQFREFQDADYQIKQTNSQFIGHSVMEYEDDNPSVYNNSDQNSQDGGFKDFVDEFENNFTNKSEDPQGMIIMRRGFGSKPVFIYQFSPNTNENWFDKMGKISEDKIIRAHGWSKRFLGNNEASGLSTNVFLDEFKIKEVTTIRSHQNRWNEVHNRIIEAAIDWIGTNESLRECSIRFTSPYEELIRKTEKMATAEKESDQEENN